MPRQGKLLDRLQMEDSKFHSFLVFIILNKYESLVFIGIRNYQAGVR